MRRHPSAETIAVHHEGLLAHRKAARVSAHLSRCPRCAMLGTELASVTAILSAAGPSSLPPSLATRLDAVLAREAARARTAPASAAPAVPGGGPQPGAAALGGGGAADSGDRGRPPAGSRRPSGQGPGRRRLVLRIASVAATVAVLGGGGYALSQLASGGASGSSASSAAAGKAPAQPAAGSAAASNGATRSAGLPVVESGTDYRAGHLRAQVVSVLDLYPFGPDTGSHSAPVPTAVARAFPHLTGCVRRVSGTYPVRLVDVARYAGRPAAVIVVQSAATWKAWVVGAECSATSSDVITSLSLPRGR